MDLELESLCKGFKELRTRSKISQTDLSKFTGLAQPVISSIEQGGGFHIKSFIILYNFYCKTIEPEKVIQTLFGVKPENNYLTILRLREIQKTQNKLFNNLIKDLE